MSFICQRCHKCVGAEAPSCPECGGALTTSSTVGPDAEPLPNKESNGEIPDRIGRYEIRERIGSGATAEVYRGFDIGLQRDVAVKVPRPELVASKETANAFLTEARTLAGLD